MSNEANTFETEGTGARDGASDEAVRAADQLACAIVDEARVSLGMAFRYLDAALWRMPTEVRRLSAPLATDGARLYADAVRVIARFRANPDEVVRDVLHAVLHCVLRHPFAPPRAREDVWARACDAAVESMALDLCAGRFACEEDDALAPLLESCTRDLGILTPAKLYRAGVDLVASGLSAQGEPVWAALFAGTGACGSASPAEADRPSAGARDPRGIDDRLNVDGLSGVGVLPNIGDSSSVGVPSGICARDSHEVWRAVRDRAGERPRESAGEQTPSEGAAVRARRSASEDFAEENPGDGRRRERGEDPSEQVERRSAAGQRPEASNGSGKRRATSAQSGANTTANVRAGAAPTASAAATSAQRTQGEAATERVRTAADDGDATTSDSTSPRSSHADAPADRAGATAASRDRRPTGASHVSSASSEPGAAGEPAAGAAREHTAGEHPAQRETPGRPPSAPAPADARRPAKDASSASAKRALGTAPEPSVRPLSEVDPATLERSWEQVARTVSAGRAAQTRRHGNRGGAFEQNLELACRTRTDYAEFLRRFATMAEDQRLSPDEFDYVYYAYGLRRYGNLPLIEPLEYQERRRVREFVIAIDTSGSTQGDLVRAFVTRTYEILHAHEQFGDVVNIHLIQADARIQSDTVVRSVDELDRFARTMTVRGGGGTDFRPVFAYVERLREQGVFEKLQGLVYFTDGWGTFPDRPPDYDTAFVFVEEDGAARWVPPWAMRVVMDKDQVRDLGRGTARPAGADRERSKRGA